MVGNLDQEANALSTIIIRSCGERTTQACYAAWHDVFPAATIHVVMKAPFFDALRETFRLGTQSPSVWFTSCDADVLPDRDAIAALPSLAAQQHADVFTINCRLHDWFCGIPRCAGLRMYRTAWAPTLQSMVEDADRPEARLVEGIVNRGEGRLVEPPQTFGKHDCEQYYRDIARKAAHHAINHKRKLPELLRRWKAHPHADFRVARAALERMPGPSFDPHNAATFDDLCVHDLLRRLGLKEKGLLLL